MTWHACNTLHIMNCDNVIKAIRERIVEQVLSHGCLHGHLLYLAKQNALLLFPSRILTYCFVYLLWESEPWKCWLTTSILTTCALSLHDVLVVRHVVYYKLDNSEKFYLSLFENSIVCGNSEKNDTKRFLCLEFSAQVMLIQHSIFL